MKPQWKPRPWHKRLWRMLWLYAGIPYLSVTLIFVVLQRRLIYRPSVAADLSVAACRLPPETARDISIQTDDGARLKGWVLFHNDDRSGKSAAPLVQYFSGNAANRFERLSDLRELTAAGFDVLIFDYRGYGDSTGSPSEFALEKDAKTIWQFAQRELMYDPSRIVVFGESLGGAVALSLWSAGNSDSSRPAPAAVILNSTFSSMSDIAASNYPWFPFRYLLFDRWPSSERIARIDSPVIIFHGTADEMVPFALGQKLAARANNGRLITVSGGTHNSIPLIQVRQELQQIRHRLSADEDVNPQLPP